MKNTADAERIIDCARAWLGTPYVHQASLKHVGCDCLGLIRGVWREVEGDEPTATPSYSSVWSEVSGVEALLEAGEAYFQSIGKDQASAGDMLVFRLRPTFAAKHAAILTAQDTFIHAYDGNSVVESSLTDFWRRRIAGVFRFPSLIQNGDH